MSNALLLSNDGLPIVQVFASAKKSESHSFMSQPTEITLESGAQVSDHVIVKPIEITVTFMVENTANDTTNPDIVFSTLREYWKTRKLLELLTEHDTYKNMVITEFIPLHQAPFKGALDCSIKLRQISFANNQIIKLPKPKAQVNATYKTAMPKVPAGKVPALPKAKGAITQFMDSSLLSNVKYAPTSQLSGPRL